MKALLGAAVMLAALCAPALADTTYVARSAVWTDADERGFGEFIAAIGASGCRRVDSCLRDAANPFRASDPPDAAWKSDCADLPYVLRFYYAWKRGLPFSFASDVAPLGRARDVRYSPRGNEVTARRDVRTGDDALRIMAILRDAVSSATYRIHPAQDGQDFYSPALAPGAIHPGTVIYDPNGHLALVWRIEADGRIHYIDAHPDNSLTRGVYDLRFVRAAPGMGAGFKNWRPLRLDGAALAPDGALLGGHIVPAANSQIRDFALTQYFGTGPIADDNGWKSGRFVLNGQAMDYYDYVRARLAGGRLVFDPVTEIGDMVRSNCADLSYRADAVTEALQAGMQNRPQPPRLPVNIYGTEGDWETYSTPSRDARLKTAFKELRDNAERFILLYRAHDRRLAYGGANLAADLLAAYDQAAAGCAVSYIRGDGMRVTFGYEQARQRLFRLSFDPYHCVERRWGADGAELSSCRDGAIKRAWYDAEQRLRNQIDRTYEARMDFSLDEMGGSGVPGPPDTDTRGYLLRQMP